jgi:hypothetical protein
MNMYSEDCRPRSPYDVLAVPTNEGPKGPRDPSKPPPDTIFTATIETIDNDRAYSLLGAVPRV